MFNAPPSPTRSDSHPFTPTPPHRAPRNTCCGSKCASPANYFCACHKHKSKIICSLCSLLTPLHAHTPTPLRLFICIGRQSTLTQQSTNISFSASSRAPEGEQWVLAQGRAPGLSRLTVRLGVAHRAARWLTFVRILRKSGLSAWLLKINQPRKNAL